MTDEFAKSTGSQILFGPPGPGAIYDVAQEAFPDSYSKGDDSDDFFYRIFLENLTLPTCTLPPTIGYVAIAIGMASTKVFYSTHFDTSPEKMFT
jgi:hypothetical protein